MEEIQEKQEVIITRELPNKQKNKIILTNARNSDIKPIVVEFDEELNINNLNFDEIYLTEQYTSKKFFKLDLSYLNDGYGLFKNNNLILFKFKGHLKSCQNTESSFYIPKSTIDTNNFVSNISTHNTTLCNLEIFENALNQSTHLYLIDDIYSIKKLNSEEVYHVQVTNDFVYLLFLIVNQDSIKLNYYFKFKVTNHPDCCGNVTLSNHVLRGHYKNVSDKFIKMYDTFISNSFRGISKTIQIPIYSVEYEYVLKESKVLKKTMEYLNPNSGNTVAQLNYIPE